MGGKDRCIIRSGHIRFNGPHPRIHAHHSTKICREPLSNAPNNTPHFHFRGDNLQDSQGLKGCPPFSIPRAFTVPSKQQQQQYTPLPLCKQCIVRAALSGCVRSNRSAKRRRQGPVVHPARPPRDNTGRRCEEGKKWQMPREQREGVRGCDSTASGWAHASGLWATSPAHCVTFRLVVAPLRGPGQSPVLPFACCVGLLLSVGRRGRCSCWCRFRVRGAQ